MNSKYNDELFPPGAKHPPEWREDLNPHDLAGRNTGVVGPHPELDPNNTAYAMKDVNQAFEGMTDDELKRIPVMPPGSRLEQGATYIDLKDPNRKEFTAMGGMTADADHWYVPKSDVPYTLWDRLIGVTNPERLDEGNTGATGRR